MYEPIVMSSEWLAWARADGFYKGELMKLEMCVPVGEIHNEESRLLIVSPI